MKFFRLSCLVITVFSLAGWWHWRRPASPVDHLPTIQLVCFTLPGVCPADGQQLAKTAGAWSGVTACTFNQQSGLLTATLTSEWSESAFCEKLKAVGKTAVFPKKLEPADGPQCPVPAQILIKLPTALLYASLAFGLLFLLTFKL